MKMFDSSLTWIEGFEFATFLARLVSVQCLIYLNGSIRFRGVPNFCCFEVCKSGARKHTKIGPLNPPILGQKKGG